MRLAALLLLPMAVAADEDLLETDPDIQNCIVNAQIRNTEILDNETIVFHMTGGRIYVNDLPRRCSGLKVSSKFAYNPTGSRLCNVDVIRVVRAVSARANTGPSCALGKFRRIDEEALAALKNPEPESESDEVGESEETAK